MAEIILVTGGNRSGKSDHAQTLAEKSPSRRIYVATAPLLDEEMAVRIAKHRSARANSQWHATIECQTDLKAAFADAAPFDTFLVDSLGMWVNNLLYANPETTEEDIIKHWQAVQAELDAKKEIKVIFVADEVGLGLIAADRLSRRFCDLNGRLNTLVAASAAEVTLLCCGLPLPLKQRGIN